ncbi:MAG: restriction endonuclease subunit S [bacterium]
MNFEIVKYFKLWQDKIGKYKDINIETVQFETKRIISDDENESVCYKRMGFTPKRDPEGDINWFTVGDLTKIDGLFVNNPNTKEKTTRIFINEAIDKNSTDKSKKLKSIEKGDILISFKLTVGITKIYNSDDIAYCNEAIDILTVKDGYYNKYIAYVCMLEYPKYAQKTNNGFTLNDELKKSIPILIPEGENSLLMQEALVEFIDYYKSILQEYKKFNEIVKKIDEFDKALLTKIFQDQNDSFLKRKFNEWIVKKNKYNLRWEDIKFKTVSIGEVFEIKSGSSSYKKEYNDSNKGNYPLFTGSLECAGYIESIREKDIIKNESISYNKDNDAGSKAFYHKDPYIIGPHHYGMFFKENYKNNLMKYCYYFM